MNHTNENFSLQTRIALRSELESDVVFRLRTTGLTMKRHAFKMKLKPGAAPEYQRRHDALWPELAVALREAGISDYSIFLDEESLTLFAVQKQADNHTASSLPNHPAVKKWWAHMAPLMETHPDHAPVCGELKEVFHLD